MMKYFKLYFVILVATISRHSSYGQSEFPKKTAIQLPMKNYFSKNNQLLVKLYKKINGGVLYWETWNNDDKSATVHWGLLGNYGEQRSLNTVGILALKDTVNSLIAGKVKDGFSEIPYEKQFTLTINFKLKTWGTPEDLDKREKYRNLITEHLGWTGNGRCDDGDIGSGEMTLYAEVVDPYIAIKTIPADLLRNGVKEDYYFGIMQGDKTIVEKILPNQVEIN